MLQKRGFDTVWRLIGLPAHRVGHLRPMGFIRVQPPQTDPSTRAEGIPQPGWGRGQGELQPTVAALRIPSRRLAGHQGRPRPPPSRANTLLGAHAATAAGARASGDSRRGGIMPRQTNR
jgi:hypothetical protein